MGICAQYLQATRAQAGEQLVPCSRHAREQPAATQAWRPEADLSWSGVWSQKLPWLRNMPSRSKWLNCPWSHTSDPPSSKAVCQASRKMVMLGEYLRRIRPAGQRECWHGVALRDSAEASILPGMGAHMSLRRYPDAVVLQGHVGCSRGLWAGSKRHRSMLLSQHGRPCPPRSHGGGQVTLRGPG